VRRLVDVVLPPQRIDVALDLSVEFASQRLTGLVIGGLDAGTEFEIPGLLGQGNGLDGLLLEIGGRLGIGRNLLTRHRRHELVDANASLAQLLPGLFQRLVHAEDATDDTANAADDCAPGTTSGEARQCTAEPTHERVLRLVAYPKAAKASRGHTA